MKKIILILVGFFGIGPGAFAGNTERLISVTGVAEKSLDPNILNLSIEIWSKASTAKKSQQMAANQFMQIKKTFEQYKVRKEDIQTENYSLNPEYEYDQKLRQNKMIGFRASQVFVVTFRKVDEAGLFIDALVSERTSLDSGVNLNSLSWDSDKRAQAELTTLGEAVRIARAKADEIAKAAGVKVTGVYKISHSGNTLPPGPMVRGYGLKAMEIASSSPTELAPGQVKVRVEITADYEIN